VRGAAGAWGGGGSTGDVSGVGEEGVLAPRVADAIEALWRDGGVQDCYRRSREYQLNDSAAYFFDAVRRVSQLDFVPTDDDVLRCRVKSTGISEITYKINNDTNFKYGPRRIAWGCGLCMRAARASR
jgi:hypothetical protein